MATQKFQCIADWSDPLFTSKVKLDEFILDLPRAFGRRITNFNTVNDTPVITLDADIPNSDGLGNLPAFDPAYYGLIRV